MSYAGAIPDDEPTGADPEGIAAALLKVDPEGITGQAAGRGKLKDDEDEPSSL